MKKKHFLLFPFVIIPASIIFYIKHVVSHLIIYDKKLDKRINSLETSIRTLKADWAYLNDPRRIERLSVQYLKMVPLQSKQVIRKTGKEI